MKQEPNANCFAKQCLNHHKQLIARELRKQIAVNGWTQRVAGEIMGVSPGVVGSIIRGEEWRISFDTMFVAATYAGLTFNIGVVTPD